MQIFRNLKNPKYFWCPVSQVRAMHPVCAMAPRLGLHPPKSGLEIIHSCLLCVLPHYLMSTLTPTIISLKWGINSLTAEDRPLGTKPAPGQHVPQSDHCMVQHMPKKGWQNTSSWFKNPESKLIQSKLKGYFLIQQKNLLKTTLHNLHTFT